MNIDIDIYGINWLDFPVPRVGERIKYRGHYLTVIDVVYDAETRNIYVRTE